MYGTVPSVLSDATPNVCNVFTYPKTDIYNLGCQASHRRVADLCASRGVKMTLDQQPSVLLADHDALIAVDLSDALEKAGYSVLGPAGTAAEALQRLAADTPTLAVIDMVLNDGRCTHLARELRQRGIPFLVHSSCRRDHRLTGDVEGAPWLNKPALPYDVVTLLDELFLSSSTAVDVA